MSKVEEVVKYIFDEEKGDYILIDKDKLSLLEDENISIKLEYPKNKAVKYKVYNKETKELKSLNVFLFGPHHKRIRITNDFTKRNIKHKPRTSELKWIYLNSKSGLYNYEIVKKGILYRETGFKTETDAAAAFNIKMAQHGFEERL